MVHRISQEINPPSSPPLVIATGGLSGLVAPLCNIFSILRPTLTLEGLMIIYQKGRLSDA
jgi:pantothenate kinase type III